MQPERIVKSAKSTSLHVRVLVFGAGAIGSLVGGLLSIENDVTLVGREAHVNAINRRGLRITGLTTRIAWPEAATEVPSHAPDVILVSTKAYDTARAVESLRAFRGRSMFATLQNGLGNAERLAANAERVIAGTTTHGVTFVAPGEIVHAGVGDTVVGPWKGLGTADVRSFAGALTAVGIQTTVVEDVRRELWAKAVMNAAINPLTAVMRRPNGALVAGVDLRFLLGRVAREGVAAARAAGIDLDADVLAERAADVASRTADNRSSMLQDVERGHRTEIDAITGALLRVASSHGMFLAYTHALDALVRGLERSLAPPV